MYKKLQALFGRITTFLHLNKRLSKYFIFLLVSFSFWFLTIMSKEYETTICIPISYNNFPESQQLISNLESQMELKVKSYGFYLLSNNLFKSKSLVSSTEIIVVSCKNLPVNVTPPFDFTFIPLKSGNTLHICW